MQNNVIIQEGRCLLKGYYCFDCRAEFERPRVLELPGKRLVRCPECKSGKVRFRIANPPGCAYKIKVQIEPNEDE